MTNSPERVLSTDKHGRLIFGSGGKLHERHSSNIEDGCDQLLDGGPVYKREKKEGEVSDSEALADGKA